jgi:hypothetical protein
MLLLLAMTWDNFAGFTLTEKSKKYIYVRIIESLQIKDLIMEKARYS